MKPGALALISFLAAGCAAGPGVEIHRVGELQIRLYADQRTLVADLPPVLAAVESIGGTKVVGYTDWRNKRIYSIDDTRVLLHELKHYMEPDWKHGIGCDRLPCGE